MRRGLKHSPSTKFDERLLAYESASTHGLCNLSPMLSQDAFLRREQIVFWGLLRDIIKQPQTTFIIHQDGRQCLLTGGLRQASHDLIANGGTIAGRISFRPDVDDVHVAGYQSHQLSTARAED